MTAPLREWIDDQLSELRVQSEVALADTDTEGVHQLRVAVRRLRAVLKTGGGVGEARELRRELRWFFGRLGPLRDLDVLLTRFRADTAGFSPDELAAFERLMAGLAEERAVAWRRVAKALRGKRYAQLLSALAEAAPADAEAERVDVDLVAEITVPYARLHAAVEEAGEDATDEELHDLRVLGKKLRYAAELAEPDGGKPVKQLVKAAKVLQDVLGEHQDACVAEERVRRLVGTDPAEAFVAGRLVERERAEQERTRAQWYAAYEEVDRRARALLR